MFRRTHIGAVMVGVSAIVTTLEPGISAAASTPIGVVCAAATTTTTTTTTAPATSTSTTTVVVGLGLCDLVDQLPPDRLDEQWESVWDGTVIGTIQPVGCTPVSQTGSLIVVVDVDGEVFGAGRTDSGAYSCDNGGDVAPSSYSYGVDGDRADDRFALTFEDGVTITSGPIVEGHAVFQLDTGYGVVTIELQCRDCVTESTGSTLGSEVTG